MRGPDCIWAVAVALAASPALVYAQTASQVRGRVVTRAGEAVVGVVIVAGDQLIASDEAGNFELSLPPGDHVLEVSAQWIASQKIQLTLGASETKTLQVVVDELENPQGETIEVEDAAPIEPGNRKIGAAEARAVPGTSNDAAKVVHSLPGVARPPPGSGDIIVWGAAPDDTRVLVDGVPVPALFHLGGWRAAIPGEWVRDISLAPGAFTPRYGSAIGGIVDVTTELPTGRGGGVSVDALDVAGHVREDQRWWRIAAGARHSWLDRIASAIGGDAATLVPIPQWTDAYAQSQLTIGGGEARAFAWWMSEELIRKVDSDDPATIRQENLDRSSSRLGISWAGDARRGRVRLLSWFGRDRSQVDQSFGEVPAHLQQRTVSAGARTDYATTLAGQVVLQLGFDGTVARDALRRAGSLGTPAREGDVAVFGQPPGDDVAEDRWSTWTVGASPHIAADWIRGGWTLSPGLRLSGYLLTADRKLPRIGTTPKQGWQGIELVGEPRLAAQFRRGWWQLTARAGLHHQPRQPLDASAVFGTPTLGLERAWHGSVGASARFAPLDIEVIGYGRLLSGLVARHPSSAPPLATALTQDGIGDVIGAQVVATLRPWHGLAGWISYGISRSRRQDHPDAPIRLFDHDQTHLATAVAGYTRGQWSVGGRARVSSGEPRTEVIGSFVDARSGLYQPVVGPINGVRLPVFVQVDARGEYRWAVADGELSLYLELQNVTARRNAEEWAYSADYEERAAITGLPFIAVVGARWEL